MSDNKRELLKLKQGLITEEETTLDLEKTAVVMPKGKAAVANFFYHNKLEIAIAVFFVIVAAIFAYFILTDEKEDITVLLLADNEEASMFFRLEAKPFEKAMEKFVPDYNKNGKVHVRCLFIDLVMSIGDKQRNPEAITGDRIKLFTEVQSSKAVIYIGNKSVLESIPGDDMAIEDFYTAINGDEIFFNLKDSVGNGFKQNMAEFPDDLYIAVRRQYKDKKTYDNAIKAVKKIIG